MTLQYCWASDELLYPQEIISSFCEAKKCQVMLVLPQNTATKVSQVVKLPGGGEHQILVARGKHLG